MANGITVLGVIPASITRDFGQVTVIKATFDTTGSDLLIYTPAATNFAAIAGMVYAKTAAHTLKISAGATVVNDLDLPANFSIGFPFSYQDYLFISPVAGAAINIQCGASAIASMILYIVEFPTLTLN